MILINLLPHREEARRARASEFKSRLILSGLLAVMLAMLLYGYHSMLLSRQESVNAYIRDENAKLDEQIKDIKDLEAQIALLRQRQQAVEDLQQERNDPVALFNELAAKLPNGVYLVNLKQNGPTVMIQGVAQSNDRVSEFLGNLRDSALLDRPARLIEITSANITLPTKTTHQFYNFSMELTIKPHASAA